MKQRPHGSAINRLGDTKVASKPILSMQVSERAKQFLPFAAVKGLPEALAKKEKIPVSKIEISEETAMILNKKINCIQKGASVMITYFCIDTYIHLTGTVLQLDSIFRTFQIEDKIVHLDDIVDIEIFS